MQSQPLDGPGDPAVVPLFGRAQGCDQFEQRLLRFDGAAEPRSDETRDEVLYVVAGRGRGTLGGDELEYEPGTAAYLANGTEWSVAEADGLVVLSVLIESPLPGETSHAILRVDDEDVQAATAGRAFNLLATPEVGCESVTQFLGIIPVGRAPDHFHAYEEVVYVLRGNGALHIDGETATLQEGSAVFLPARIVHCLENTGPGEMHVLGVFRPAGSPAEAYYPDGTPALVTGY